MEDKACCECCDLFTWKSPPKTAVAFVGINLLFISLCYYSFLGLISLFLMYFCIAGVVLNLVYKYVSDNKEVKQEEDNTQYEYVSSEKIQSTIIAFYVRINDGLDSLKNIASLEDPFKFAKLLGLLFVLATFSYFLSDFTLVWIGAILLFTLPKIYCMYKEKIEQSITQISEIAKESLGKVLSKIPKYSDLKED